MLGQAITKKCIIKNVFFKNISLIPADVDLAGAEIELVQMEDNSFILKRYIDEIKDNYDYVIIDCPPSLSTLTVNALTTADTVLVPIQCEFFLR